VRSGDSCVLTTSCLLSGNNYPAEGIIEKDAKAFVIPTMAFHACLDQSAFFRQFVFNNFAQRLSSVISRMEELAFDPIELRLCKFLLESEFRLIKTTHQEISSELGTVREVVSRHLKRFEVHNWIKLGRGTIEVTDVIGLREFFIANDHH
jgi:CRP/FNR family transcriptional regulator